MSASEVGASFAFTAVYTRSDRRLRWSGHLLAAVLACGEGAVLSHVAAAALWNIRGSAATLIDVTVPSQNGRVRRNGIRIHRSGRLGADEATTKDGIPVTTVARTLLDLADVLNSQALKRAIDAAEYQRLFDLNALTATVNNNPEDVAAHCWSSRQIRRSSPDPSSRIAFSRSARATSSPRRERTGSCWGTRSTPSGRTPT